MAFLLVFYTKIGRIWICERYCKESSDKWKFDFFIIGIWKPCNAKVFWKSWTLS